MNQVPLVAFLMLLMLTPPNVHASPNAGIYSPRTNMVYEAPGPVSNVSISPSFGDVETLVDDDTLTYSTILTFIQSNYKQVSATDAALIAKVLVESGKNNSLDPKFVAAVVAKESAFNKTAISPSNAMGLGQLKNPENFHVTDPFDIQQNSMATVAYLKQQLGRWKDNSEKVSLALASYFQGYTAVKNKGSKLDESAQKYVNGILSNYGKLKVLRDQLQSASQSNFKIE